MKLRLMMVAAMFLLIGAAPAAYCPPLQTPGILQNTVWMYAPSATRIGGTVMLKWYSVPPIQGTFMVRNPAIASVQPDGRVRGVSPGVTYVRLKYFDCKCLKTDSVKVTVGKRPE